ncbi:MAG TPA: hypothetical protein EYN51_10720 [Flavobacteriales bacterium]|nr:hypothetical protein [Flavobacteriales bacterium]
MKENRREFREIYGLPNTVPELLEHLDLRYPNRCVGPNVSIEQAHREAGNREVVDYLLTLSADDESVVINDPVVRTIKNT